MAYATEDRAIFLYGEDTILVGCDRNKDGVLDEGVFAAFLEIATNEINGYLIGRTGDTIPLDPVPAQIEIYCIDIAIYRSRPGAAEQTEEIKDRYKAAIRYLEHVQKNKQRLVQDLVTGPAGVVNTAVQTETSSPANGSGCNPSRDHQFFYEDILCGGEGRTFTRGSMGGL